MKPLLIYTQSESTHSWAEKCRREEGIRWYFEELLYASDSTDGLRSAEPDSEQEWDSFVSTANTVGNSYDWTEIGVLLHHHYPTTSSSSTLTKFCHVCPSNSPQPWLDRDAIAKQKAAKRQMSEASGPTRNADGPDEDVWAATMAILRGNYKRAGALPTGELTRIHKPTRRRVKKAAS